MTLLWTLTATFLYAEIVVCIILMLPIISPSKWRSLFKSRAMNFIVSYANFYFGLFLLLLAVMFIDAIREIRRFSAPLANDELKGNPMAENMQHMKLFRAQRNFYIAGFSMFLFVILRRMVVMLNNSAILQADCEAAKKQAASATAAAKSLIDNQDNANIQEGKSVKEAVEKLEKVKTENEKLINELKQSKLNEEVLRKQGEATNREYDRLMAEMEKLQKKLAIGQDQQSSKKDE
ncbi:hypothetical protein HELRODRAFT_155003 [Helobdella robusta]|uniref:Endoplasmic reticulum transmembrane protein n=1 Tax=Helobdella robusta TaxID=6412 RepID=T1ELG9_HELRO|nr:hypothetical protein HELRODRAFT_155003 [Helobdella robusta]ESN99830.1 hypothetical protein HELRODRAFT_155003 [Helobdella robusta]